MKKSIWVFVLLFGTFNLFAQRGKVVSALSYKESGDLRSAYQDIDRATNPKNDEAESSINWSNSWQVKGEILQEIYRQQVKGIIDDPLFKAFDAYIRAIELDADGRYAKSIVSDLIFLQTDFSNFAVSAYQKENFNDAMRGFESFINISNLPIMNGKRGEVYDTTIIYNAAISAYKSENWDKAIHFFSQSVKNNYNSSASINYIYEAYQAKGDTLNSISYLKNEFENYPNDATILAQLIRFFMTVENNEETVKYLNMAIEKEPDNPSLYMIKANILEKINDKEAAVECYKSVININNNEFAPYYNIGIIYYNIGVNAFNEAKQLPSGSLAYDEKIATGITNFKLALPNFEKANAIDSKQTSVLGSLRIIYYRLQMVDQYNAISEKIKSLNE